MRSDFLTAALIDELENGFTSRLIEYGRLDTLSNRQS